MPNNESATVTVGQACVNAPSGVRSPLTAPPTAATSAPSARSTAPTLPLLRYQGFTPGGGGRGGGTICSVVESVIRIVSPFHEKE